MLRDSCDTYLIYLIKLYIATEMLLAQSQCTEAVAVDGKDAQCPRLQPSEFVQHEPHAASNYRITPRLEARHKKPVTLVMS